MSPTVLILIGIALLYLVMTGRLTKMVRSLTSGG